MREYSNFDSFFPFYLREHARAKTRALHYVGSTLAILALVASLVTQTWWGLLAVPLAGYFFAWISHAFVERNRPATFTYPLWSLIGDYKMFWLFLTGRLDGELKRAGVNAAGEVSAPQA
ncbi:Mpo1-like protein [Maricaulis sp. CAU 1757]